MEESIKIKLAEYFSKQPVSKAWLFGSRSRGDNRDDSDFDIMVDFDKGVGLFKYASILDDLQKILKRGVDLVTETSLFPWVKDNVNDEKILIYERKAKIS